MADWLNRIGMTLQFVSLFLVSPEVLGEARVRAIMQTLWAKPIAYLKAHPAIAIVTFACAPQLVYIGMHGGLTGYYNVPFTHDLIRMGVGIVLEFVAVAISILLGSAINSALEALIRSERTYIPMGVALYFIGFVLMMWATFV